ncbi:leucine-rich repeat-containing protein 59 [Lucilia cuprina]|uniref:leucine-rich repeat-containing protein 59 n=1 Tax=Lucilia cuprina TaxID=7375 RepID=UPI001F06A6FC|nr:leucine-rich repeat-containing protein 59 [Lucilia cuprina]KAI8115483.1 Leucine-rich repeat-containing protein 59 [Lucilia cuprina]
MPKANKVNVKEKVEDNVCDLSLSELREIPVKEIASFKRVNVLDLSSNRLMSLGKNFSTLTRLVKLDLSKNQIKFLPEDFGLLRNLRHLDLYNNQLEHLPLSFGDLTNLRYLDLKGNPLTPALTKIVGICTTTKDCQDSAKRTVKFMSAMQVEAIKAKEQYKQEILQNQNTHSIQDEIENSDKSQELPQKSKKSKKSKSKKKSSNNQDSATHTVALSADDNITIAKTTKNKKSANGSLKYTTKSVPPSTALTSLIIFLLMVAFNVVLIYMIMFKNPEIAEKIVESIPHQYRDWILTKTEIFRLRVTDWISEFRTPPEEH